MDMKNGKERTMNLSLREIEYVLAVAAEENITKAAQHLYIAQPSLSQSLKKIEKEYGVPIFIRVQNRLKLTQEGELFVEAGNQVTKILRDLKNSVKEINDLKGGRLILGMPYHLGAFVVPNVLLRFKQEFPDIDIQLHETTSTELERMVFNGSIDLAIMPLPLKNKSINYQPFLKSRMVLVVVKSDPLNNFSYEKGFGEKYPYVDLRNATSTPFIIGNRGQRIRAINELIFQKAQISPPIILYSRNVETIIHMASIGIGAALVPEQYLSSIPPDPGLANCYYLEPEQDHEWTIVAAFLGAHQLPAASRKFLEILHTTYSTEGTHPSC
jgi:DNA-binding transcriptional LysR family regulator